MFVIVILTNNLKTVYPLINIWLNPIKRQHMVFFDAAN